MSTDVFERHVQQSLERLEDLWQRSSAIPLPDSELWQEDRQFPQQQRQLLRESLTELSASIEELQLASEALRRQNEELLSSRLQIEREKQHYRDLFDSAPDCYLVTSQNGTIREVNQQASRLLKVSAVYLRRKALAVFIDLPDRQKYYNKLNQIKKGEITHTSWNFKLITRDRQSIPVECTVFTKEDIVDNTISLCWRIAPLVAAQPQTNNSNLTTMAISRLRPSVGNIATQVEELKIRDLNQQPLNNYLRILQTELIDIKAIVDDIYILECLPSNKNITLSLIDYVAFARDTTNGLYLNKIIPQPMAVKHRESCVGICDIFLLEKVIVKLVRNLVGHSQSNDILLVELSRTEAQKLLIKFKLARNESNEQKLSAIAEYLVAPKTHKYTSWSEINLAVAVKCLHLLQGKIELRESLNIGRYLAVELPLILNV